MIRIQLWTIEPDQTATYSSTLRLPKPRRLWRLTRLFDFQSLSLVYLDGRSIAGHVFDKDGKIGKATGHRGQWVIVAITDFLVVL